MSCEFIQFYFKDEDGYATCSVSDLVAVFEAKAAQIAAMESASLCSESVEAAAVLPLVAPAATQATETIALGNGPKRIDLTPEHPLTRASHLVGYQGYDPKGIFTLFLIIYQILQAPAPTILT